MRNLGPFDFPETPAETSKWTANIHRYVLDPFVMVVATTRIEGRWSAYCATVPGVCHDLEMGRVLREGTKIPEELARHMFPAFEGLVYAR